MATMKDVARLAGVSTSTVSHVINKDRFVSEAITAKVEAAIKELNYAPSALARSLKLNQTHTIGMLITASTNPFYSELVRGVERSCFERGYSLVLCNTEGDEQRMNRNLETLMQKRVDGLLLLCTETHQPSREIMQRYPTVPTVMMDWAPFDGDSDLIQDNSLLGGDLATQYLIDKGHTRIACITDGAAVEIHLIAKFFHDPQMMGAVHLFNHKPLVFHRNHQIGILFRAAG